MPHFESKLHVQGKSHYVDDAPEPAGLLHGAIFTSPVAHGTIEKIDLEAARNAPGVVGVYSWHDIPDEKMLGPLVQDEPLFAHDVVKYQGQTLAFIVAETRSAAQAAVKLCKVQITPLPAVTCPRVAFENGNFLEAPKIYEMGAVDGFWGQCAHVVEGKTHIHGQEHLYLETQRSRVIPGEDHHFTIHASTQSPSAVQKNVARILGLPMHKIEVDVKRLGGAFGGKEDQATHWACMAAIAAQHLNRPVQIVLSRIDDLRSTGKRHPYKQDFKIGLDAEGHILAFEVMHYQNGGAYTDLSPSVLERTVLHSTNAYAIPNVRIKTASCQTNEPPNTAYRGFGAPQGMFCIESAIHQAALKTGIPAEQIQEKNLVCDDYRFHYGQVLKQSRMQRTWHEAYSHFQIEETKQRIEQFNATHDTLKKGLALMPICFGIAFTKSFLNQASSLAHIYSDGTVNITTGAIEMGQGVSSNIITIASKVLGVSTEHIKFNSTNTFRIANISPSAASSTTDLNGNATAIACRTLKASLLKAASRHLNVKASSLELKDSVLYVDGEAANISWTDLVSQAYLQREQLMAHGFYAAPVNEFDGVKGKGSPFHYYSFGTCAIEATVDCILGTYKLESAQIVHDLGRTLIPTVDLGQIEGGLAQGIGWMTTEEIVFDENGTLRSNTLSTYKPPNAQSMPTELQVKLLENVDSPMSPLGKKAVGEPPFCYGIAAYFAIWNAIRAFDPEKSPGFTSPFTPERVLMELFG